MPLHSKETEVLGSEGFSTETPLVLKPHLYLLCPEGSSGTRPEVRSMCLHWSLLSLGVRGEESHGSQADPTPKQYKLRGLDH